MKKILISTIFILTCSLTFSQNWQWAKHLGGINLPNNPNSEGASSIITDGTNYYVIGPYWNILYMPSDTLNSNGLNDIFITKFDASGNQLWAKTLGGNFNQPTSTESAYGVYDSIGNCIYIAGWFVNSINFGSAGTLNSPASYESEIFLAKMDLNGNFIWAKKGGGPGRDLAWVYLTPNQKIYLVTQSYDSAYFDSFSLGPGGAIVQYDTSGTCLSAEEKFTLSFGNLNYVYLDFIDSDLVIYGLFKSDTFQLDTATLINHGGYDAFLARADSNGNVKWIKAFGNAGDDAFYSLSTDNSHNLFVTGSFKDSINLGGSTLINNNGNDILVAKFDANGNSIWSEQAAANGNSQAGYKILCDGDGNCYVTGLFSGSASFGTYNVSTTNQYDMFLSRYASNGDCLGIRQFGTASGTCLTADNSGNVVCGGPFINSVTIGSNTFTAYQAYDIFIAKIDEFTGIGGEERVANNRLIIYANPNAGKCNITIPDEFLHANNLTLQIFDNTGKLLQQTKVEMMQEKVKINLEEEAKGIYNVILSNGKKSYNGKIVFE